MLDIIGHKNRYFIFSLLVIIPGLVSLLLFGLNLSIDFTGGSRISLLFPKKVTDQQVEKIQQAFTQQKVHVTTIQKSDTAVFLRTSPVNDKQNTVLQAMLKKDVGEFKQEEFETIGPTVGKEITLNALKSIAIASLLIMLYIAISFRSVPRPTSSWRFGVCTILALLHDVLVLVGLFSILGHFFHVEVDSLFVTAVLTVIGFSVHDTIVVFDRVRENLLKTTGASFPQLVNDSILQTMTRSLNTSLTALLVLFTLLIFGGGSIHWFVVALLIGIASGTYSSIFNAAPLLVFWHEWDQRKRSKKKI